MSNLGTILVVDDNVAELQLLAETLTAEGYLVRSAVSGEAALDSFATSSPELILLSIRMSGMDGFEVCRRLEQHKESGKIPIILLRAASDPLEWAEGIKLGAVDIISKPLQRDELLTHVQTHMELSRLQAWFEHHAVEMQLVSEQLKDEVAQREEAESALLEEERKLRTILDSTAEAIYGVDLNGYCTFCNAACLRLLGYTQGTDLIGKNMHRQIHHRHPNGSPYPEEACRFSQTFREGKEIHLDDEVLWRADGSSFPAEFRSHPQYRNGVLVGAVVTFLDIAEKRALEEQLRHSQKMEAIGTLVGGVAHDFNNILTGILGYGNFLQMKMKEDDPLREYAGYIIKGGEKAAGLTRNLLAFSRKQRMNLKTVDLNVVIRGMLPLLQGVMGEGIRIELACTKETLVIRADSGQLEQVLLNLATNARDAISDVGELTIETGTVELDKKVVALPAHAEQGRYALLMITDTGKGIDHEIRGMIFDPFFTTKEVGKGTGLGLSIVHGIIKQHGGFIDLDSEPGRGTSVRIYLPLSGNALEEKKGETLPSPRGGVETILVVEDDETVRSFSTEILKEFGYRVIEAADGKEAVTRFCEHKDEIQLVLLDMRMPLKNGREAYDEIKGIRPNIAAIFMSGYTSDVLDRKGFPKELDLVMKPIPPLDLVRKVREVLDRQVDKL